MIQRNFWEIKLQTLQLKILGRLELQNFALNINEHAYLNAFKICLRNEQFSKIYEIRLTFKLFKVRFQIFERLKFAIRNRKTINKFINGELSIHDGQQVNLLLFYFITILFYYNLQFYQTMLSQTPSCKTQEFTLRASNMNYMNSPADLKKVIKALQKLANDQRQKRQAVEQQLQDFKYRAIRRQSELGELVNKLNDNKIQLLNQNPEINKLFSTIWQNFDEFNQRSIQIISQRYEQNLQSLNRKIKNIMRIMKQELEINAKKSNVDVGSIINDIRHVCDSAVKIQQRNALMSVQLKKLRFELKVLKQQKFLAIQDALQRKAKVTFLTQQNKKLIQQLDQHNFTCIKKEHNNKNHCEVQRQPSQAYQQCFTSQNIKSYQSHYTQNQHSQGKKILNKNKSEIYSLQSIFQNHQLRMQTLLNFKEKKQFIIKKPILATSTTNKNSQNLYKTNASIVVNPKKYDVKLGTQKPNKSLSKRSSKDRQILSTSEKKNRTKNLATAAECSNDKQTKIREYHYIQTIQNLQQCLKRQKNKTLTLGSIVTKMNNKNKQINQTLQLIIKEAQKQPDKLKYIQQSQKLFKIIKVLKKRLNALQSPAVNIGWGDTLGSIQ